LSTDPLFVDKVKDRVGLYLDPPERAAVLCVDEKSKSKRSAASRRLRSRLRHRGDHEVDRRPDRGDLDAGPGDG
jgi:hypothetical protein